MHLSTALAARAGTRLAPSGPAARRQRCSAAPAAMAGGAAEGRDATGLSSLRIGKPSAADMDALMSDWSSRSCNHEFAGASKAAPNLPAAVQQGGFMISKKREKVGEGKATYERAVKAVKEWQHLQLGWNCTTSPTQRPGTTICSATQTVVPWSVLPAQVVYSEDSAAEFGPGDKGRRFALGLCSLQGHQLAGEERFQVELHADGSVYYDVFLFSRPDTLLAWASLPVVKIMQLRYVTDSVKAVSELVKA